MLASFSILLMYFGTIGLVYTYNYFLCCKLSRVFKDFYFLNGHESNKTSSINIYPIVVQKLSIDKTTHKKLKLKGRLLLPPSLLLSINCPKKPLGAQLLVIQNEVGCCTHLTVMSAQVLPCILLNIIQCLLTTIMYNHFHICIKFQITIGLQGHLCES